MSMYWDGEFRRNPSVAARGFTSIEAMEFVRHEFPQVTAWTYWEVYHLFMGHLVDGKRWSGSIGEWRWEPVPCSYPAVLIWDSKVRREGSLLGFNWTGVLKMTGPDNIEFLLFSHLNAMGNVGLRYLISTQDPVVIERFSDAVYAHFSPKANKERAIAEKGAGPASISEVTTLLLSVGLNILAGRVGQGKTSIALMLADYLVKRQGHAVLYISAGQQIEHLRSRSETLGLLPCTFVKMTPTQQTPAAIFVDDRSCPDVDSIIKDSDMLANDFGMIVVDLLQLMKQKADNILDVSESVWRELHRLRALAISLKIPILLLSQLRNSALNDSVSSPSVMQIPDAQWVEPNADIICVVSSVPERRRQHTSPDFYKLNVLKNVNWTLTFPSHLF